MKNSVSLPGHPITPKGVDSRWLANAVLGCWLKLTPEHQWMILRQTIVGAHCPPTQTAKPNDSGDTYYTKENFDD